MSQTVTCPRCNHEISLPDDAMGDAVVCPNCRECAPSDAARQAHGAPLSDNEVRKIQAIAGRQRGMLFALAASLCFIIVLAVGSKSGSWHAHRSGPPALLVVLLLGFGITSVIMHILFLMLSVELRMVGLWVAATFIDVLIPLIGSGQGLALGPIVTLLSLINVVCVLIVNGMATNRLRAVGVGVGLLGASSMAITREALERNTACAERE